MSRRAVATRAALSSIVAVALLGVVGCSGDTESAATEPEPSSPSTTAARPEPSSGSAGVGAPAPSQVDAHRPTELTLPSGQAVPVDTTATAPDGELAIPTNIDRAGWWDGSARLGDPFGGIVVAAHIDSFEQGLGRFAELLSVRRGDEIDLAAGPLTQTFRVVSAELVPKSQVDADAEIYSVRGASRLVLITCGGAYDPASGYQDNLIVVAHPNGPIEAR